MSRLFCIFPRIFFGFFLHFLKVLSQGFSSELSSTSCLRTISKFLRKKNFSLNFAKKHSQVLFHHGIITQIFLSEEKRKISARASGTPKPTR